MAQPLEKMACTPMRQAIAGLLYPVGTPTYLLQKEQHNQFQPVL